MISSPYRTISSWKTLGASPVALVLMNGSTAGSRGQRGSSVMKSAPRIDAGDRCRHRRSRTMAMNSTEITRLKLSGVNVAGTDVEQRAGAPGVERGDRERDRSCSG